MKIFFKKNWWKYFLNYIGRSRNDLTLQFQINIKKKFTKKFSNNNLLKNLFKIFKDSTLFPFYTQNQFSSFFFKLVFLTVTYYL